RRPDVALSRAARRGVPRPARRAAGGAVGRRPAAGPRAQPGAGAAAVRLRRAAPARRGVPRGRARPVRGAPRPPGGAGRVGRPGLVEVIPARPSIAWEIPDRITPGLCHGPARTPPGMGSGWRLKGGGHAIAREGREPDAPVVGPRRLAQPVLPPLP